MLRERFIEYPLVRNVVLFNSTGWMCFDDHIVKSITLGHAVEETMREYRERGVLLLEGGEDISPTLYGEANRYSYGYGHKDRREIAQYRIARTLDIPVLGICRGHQLMAALNGGSLHQDIRMDLGVRGHGTGPLTFPLGSPFAEWYPEGYTANSAHHQCVNRVPENAIVAAVDKRNPVIIEALAYPDGCDVSKARMFSVQFHPEFMGDHELLQHIVNWLFEER